MKRILSIVLTLLLCLALVIPSAAADDSTYAPVIIQQPTTKFGNRPPYVQAGDSLEIEALATVSSDAGTLSYAWYDYDWQPGDTAPPIATGARVSIPTTEDMLHKNNEKTGNLSVYATYSYCVVVTHTWLDDAQVQQTAFVKSEVVNVKIFADYDTAVAISWDNAMRGGFFALFTVVPFTMLSMFFNLFGILGCKLNVWTTDLSYSLFQITR